MSAYKGPRCGCGATKTEGRCSARPSCSDYATVKQLKVRDGEREERLREQLRREEVVGVNNKALTKIVNDLAPLEKRPFNPVPVRVMRAWRKKVIAARRRGLNPV